MLSVDELRTQFLDDVLTALTVDGGKDPFEGFEHDGMLFLTLLKKREADPVIAIWTLRPDATVTREVPEWPGEEIVEFGFDSETIDWDDLQEEFLNFCLRILDEAQGRPVRAAWSRPTPEE